MTADNLEPANFIPYIAPVLLEAKAGERDEALLVRLVREIDQSIARTGPARGAGGDVQTRRRLVYRSDIDRFEGLFSQLIVYCETTSPRWLVRGALEDRAHQLIVVSVHDRNAAICATDAAMRDRLVKKVKSVRRVPRTAVAAFVGTEARALWLNGIHTPTASKADTKALTGTSLEYALDSIGDQTYYYSAARTHADVAGLLDARGRRLLIGAAPAGARVWIGRSISWADFRTKILAIFRHATSGTPVPNPFEQLARAIDSPTGVKDAYAVSVVPRDLLSEDDVDPGNLEAARRWAFDAEFDVTGTNGLPLTVRPILYGQAIGRLALQVTLDDGTANIAVKWTDKPAGFEAERAECARFLGDPDSVKIYYDSGHTVAQGKCYEGGYSDQPFGWTSADFAGYDVKSEKPVFSKKNPLAGQIAIAGDTSLFAFVCQKMFLDGAGKPKGWLACDDGSMEMADFIHIDPDANVVSLVHVKGSKSDSADRGAAPADFEIVVSQAVKNLRHLDRRNLVEELKKGKAKAIGAAVWLDGVRQPDRGGFLDAASKFKASHRKKLVVLQPRVTLREVALCDRPGTAPGRVLRLKQINTLMLAGRASALACGAEFEGYCDALT